MGPGNTFTLEPSPHSPLELTPHTNQNKARIWASMLLPSDFPSVEDDLDLGDEQCPHLLGHHRTGHRPLLNS